MKRPTVKDATREEFVEFFTTSIFGRSGLHQFESWLCNRRYKVLDDEMGAILDQMDKSNKEMYEWSQKALNESDSKKKMDYYIKAAECQEEWSRLNRQYDRLQRKMDRFLGLKE